MVIFAARAVKHEDIVGLVKRLFTKLSTDPTTASQLVAKEPTIFTGSKSMLGSWNKNLGSGKPDCLDDLAYAIMYEMSKLSYRVSEADVTRARNQLKLPY
ncbi:hypothetical protein HHK36_017214 [Tetracentron sinense]|uniref:Uncharacterized protein n=1 Tax=Tetracentron sinense TaxID=13715 RepID=A0A834Z7K6_TETSI|nr:hypothetical protein HHK36_017214 [Tetracentron sinense]